MSDQENTKSSAKLKAIGGVILGILVIGIAVHYLGSSEVSSNRSQPPPPVEVPPINDNSEGSSPSATKSPPPTYTGSGSEGENQYSKTPEGRAEWGRLAKQFGTNFTDKSPGWFDRLKPLLEPSLAKQLQDVDPSEAPNGKFVKYEAASTSNMDVTAKIVYDTNMVIKVQMYYDGQKWSVTSYY